MQAAIERLHEARDQRALDALDVLDTGPEPTFDALVRAASLTCGTPIALVSLIDRERQWFKANLGLPGVSETHRDLAFCAHAVLDDELLEVEDAERDPRFEDNPLVTDAPSIRFYAGMPIQLSGGENVGTLCVLDREPRKLTEEQREILRCLAVAAAHVLEGRRALAAIAETERALRVANDRIALATESGGIGTWEMELATYRTHWDRRMFAIYGLATLPEDAVHQAWEQRLAPGELPRIRAAVAQLVAGTAPFDLEFAITWPDGAPRFVRTTARVRRDGPDGETTLIGATWDVTESRELAEALRRQAVVTAVQAGVATAANEATSLLGALQAALDVICQQTRWDLGHAYLPSPEEPGLLLPTPIWTADPEDRFVVFRELTARSPVRLGVGLVGAVLADGAPHFLDLDDPRFPRRAGAVASGLRYGVAAPVLVGSEVVAVLELFTVEPGPCDDAFRSLVSYTGLQIGRVVDRERAQASLRKQAAALREQSTMDELTGLLNRRGFLELAGDRLRTVKNGQQRAFLVFADLDGMKRINDELGHEAGDLALIEAAGVLRRTLRSTDLVARLGGDEFVAFAWETGVFDGASLTRRLEAEVATVNAEPGRRWSLAISFGISRPEARDEPITAMLKRADELMYAQKQARKRAQRERGG